MSRRANLLQCSGFSRKELLLTLGCLALLAAVFIAWRIRSLDLPSRKTCERNLRQLLTGFNSYESDMGRFPSAARSGFVTNDDWIFWQTERLLLESPLAHRATNYSGSLRCPADTRFSFRPYPYSYSMNINFERASIRRIPNLSELILLYEEEAPNDGACFPGGPSDALGKRHLGRSNAGFIDGHVEQIDDKFGSSKFHAGK